MPNEPDPSTCKHMVATITSGLGVFQKCLICGKEVYIPPTESKD